MYRLNNSGSNLLPCHSIFFALQYIYKIQLTLLGVAIYDYTLRSVTRETSD